MAKSMLFHTIIAITLICSAGNAMAETLIDCSNIDSDELEKVQTLYADHTAPGLYTYNALAEHDLAGTCRPYDCIESERDDITCGSSCTPDDAQQDGDNCKCDSENIDKDSMASQLCQSYAPDGTTPEICYNLIRGNAKCDTGGNDVITCANDEYLTDGVCTPCPPFVYDGQLQQDLVRAPENATNEEQCYVPSNTGEMIIAADERGTYTITLDREVSYRPGENIACTFYEE